MDIIYLFLLVWKTMFSNDFIIDTNPTNYIFVLRYSEQHYIDSDSVSIQTESYNIEINRSGKKERHYYGQFSHKET